MNYPHRILEEQPLYLQRISAQPMPVSFGAYRRSDVWEATFNDVQVFGPGFLHQGVALPDGVWHSGMSHSNHSMLLTAAMTHYPAIPDGGYLDAECRLLWGHHTFMPGIPSNWGHFLWTYLMRLAFVDPLDEWLPLLVSDKVPERFLDWARSIGFHEFVRVADGTRVRRLHVNSVLAHRCADPGQTVAVLPSAVYALRHRLGVRLPDSPRVDLYLSRKNAGWRAVANEPELIDALKSRHFGIITPEAMTSDEQLSIITRARKIVVPIGGGSPITMLAPEDCQIIELGFPQIKGVFASAVWADVLGQRYVRVNGTPGEQRGPLAIDRDYMIDVNKVLEQL